MPFATDWYCCRGISQALDWVFMPFLYQLRMHYKIMFLKIPSYGFQFCNDYTLSRMHLAELHANGEHQVMLRLLLYCWMSLWRMCYHLEAVRLVIENALICNIGLDAAAHTDMFRDNYSLEWS